jgi:hypothetical protein
MLEGNRMTIEELEDLIFKIDLMLSDTSGMIEVTEGK